MHHTNNKFKKQLGIMAQGRGKRPLLPTKVHDKDFRRRKQRLHFRDEMDELNELRKQGIKIG